MVTHSMGPLLWDTCNPPTDTVPSRGIGRGIEGTLTFELEPPSLVQSPQGMGPTKAWADVTVASVRVLGLGAFKAT